MNKKINLSNKKNNINLDNINLDDTYKKKVYIYSNGCVPNRLCGKKIGFFFESFGWTLTDDPTNPDLIIFNTCGFSGSKIKETLEIIKIFSSEKNNKTEFVVTGCLPKINTDIIKTVFKGLVLNTEELGKKFGSKNEMNNLYVSGSIDDILDVTKKDIYHIMTSTGCQGKCSYCIIKAARGKIKSKPINEIKNEFNNSIMLGYKKFILWGDDLGAYGQDISSNYIELLKSLIDSSHESLNYHLSLYRLNPQWLIKYFHEFKEVLKTRRIRMIYSPVQSGSERILKLMRREYTSKDVMFYFKLIKQKFPSIALKTDIMVGFPTESDEDFRQTVNLIKEVKFDEIAVFNYSPVPKTPAFYFKEQINNQIKFERFEILMNLINKRKEII